MHKEDALRWAVPIGITVGLVAVAVVAILAPEVIPIVVAFDAGAEEETSTLTEQLAIDEVRASPEESGGHIQGASTQGDLRYKDIADKWSSSRIWGMPGNEFQVHYYQNINTGEFFDFKIKPIAR